MKRVARGLFTTAAALSVVPCLYCVLLAVADLREPPPQRGYGLYFQPLGPERRHTTGDANVWSRLPPPAFDFAGFRVQRTYRVTYTLQEGRLFVLPYGVLAVLWAIPPSLRLCRSLRRARASRRLRRGLCPACDYDLRASPGGCPECGAAGGP